MLKRLPGFLLIFALLAAWELGSRAEWIDPVTFPPISTIAEKWFSGVFGGPIYDQILPSLWRIFAGFALGCVIGIPLGLVMGTNPFVYRLLEPLTEFVRPIPSAAYIPVAILILGIGDGMKIFVIFLACLFPILLNTLGGVRAIDPVLIDTGRTFGLSHQKALRQIVLPASTPSILTGMRISLGLALIVAVVSEMIAGSSGVGFYVLDMQRIFQIPDMYAGIFFLGMLGYVINFGFIKVESWLLRWRGDTNAI